MSLMSSLTSRSLSPMSRTFSRIADLSNRRIVMRSPCTVGAVATRMSMSLPAILIRMRPS